MRRFRTAASSTRRSLAFLSLSVALGLAGCGSIDDALFGSDNSDQAEAPAQPAQGDQNASGQAAGESAPAGEAGTLPGATEGALPPQSGPVETSTAPGITPVTISAGSDTGTAVGHTVQDLRSQVSAIQDKIVTEAQELANLKATAAQSSETYLTAKATITTHLQLGTTRGNPELVAQWNSAQSALDALTANVNSVNELGMEIANQSSSLHAVLNTIDATFNVAGAVDADHQQLSLLRDEADQVNVIVDSLLTGIPDTVERETTFLANERASLSGLAGAIRDGNYYGDLSAPYVSSRGFGGGVGGPALVTIRFDHPNVSYKRILYTAVSQALSARPGASFVVVGVSPTRGTAVAVQLAQTQAERHAGDVQRSLQAMGVSATRVAMSSSTDPSIHDTEVRVYIR